MASPTFNSVKLFDLTATGTSNTVPEGLLYVEDYSAIWQRIHFLGEDGDRWLCHGYPDRNWYYTGLLSGQSLTAYASKILAIEAAIDLCAGDPTTYYSLVDSFGNTYTNAQIRQLNYLEPPHYAIDGGYVCKVHITGILQGTKANKEGSSSTSGGG